MLLPLLTERKAKKLRSVLQVTQLIRELNKHLTPKSIPGAL